MDGETTVRNELFYRSVPICRSTTMARTGPPNRVISRPLFPVDVTSYARVHRRRIKTTAPGSATTACSSPIIHRKHSVRQTPSVRSPPTTERASSRALNNRGLPETKDAPPRYGTNQRNTLTAFRARARYNRRDRYSLGSRPAGRRSTPSCRWRKRWPSGPWPLWPVWWPTRA